MSHTTLTLAKQNFKFSSAHFLIFDAHSAEKLHGHNYQVKVELAVPGGPELETKGYFIDFNVFKKHIKAKLDTWDEMLLLPKLHTEVLTTEKDSSLEVRFRERFYVFPKNEVLLLPVTNTSVEQLSRLLAEDFYLAFAPMGVKGLSVLVEETPGQGARTVVGELF